MKEIKILKQALGILKKEHKQCREFDIYCPRCTRSLVISALEHTIATQCESEKVEKLLAKLRKKS